jgi:hypothetical protein
MFVLTAVGAASAFFLRGLPWALGFLVGAAFSIVNFRSFEKIVSSIGVVTGGKPPKRISTVLLGVRYFIFVAVAYGIIKFFEANFLAALAGFFVCVAAVIIEILYELIYA